MNRRQVLSAAAVCGTAALAGCSGLIHRARGANTPLSLVVESSENEGRTVDIQVERDGNRMFEGSVSFDADGSIVGVEGDDFREAAFERPGEYTVVAETATNRDDTATEISWRDLADCNSHHIWVHLDDAVRVSFWRTDADCGGLDRL